MAPSIANAASTRPTSCRGIPGGKGILHGMAGISFDDHYQYLQHQSATAPTTLTINYIIQTYLCNPLLNYLKRDLNRVDELCQVIE